MRRLAYEALIFWGPRRESPENCARRFSVMLRGLSTLSPAFARWNNQGFTETESMVPFCTMPPRIPELAQILENARYYGDATGEPMPALGFSTSAWNTRRDSLALWMLVTVGAFSTQNPDPNQIWLNFHPPDSDNETLLNADVLSRALSCIATAWDADWGVVQSSAIAGRLEDAQGNLLRPWGGWITYLSQPLAREFTPPGPTETEETPGGGLLVFVTRDQFDAANPAHVAVADMVQRALHPGAKPPRPNLRLVD